MIINKRDDYRFVEKDDIKRITVDGSPYPLRLQKLILRGEDEAFFEEARVERLRLKGDSATVAFADPPVLKISQKARRGDWWLAKIKDMMIRGWIDPAKFPEFNAMNPVVIAEHRIDSKDAHDKPEAIDLFIRAAREQLEGEAEKLEKTKERLAEILGVELESEYNKMKELVVREEEAVEDLKKQTGEELEKEVKAIDRKHKNNIAQIRQTEKDGIIDRAECENKLMQAEFEFDAEITKARISAARKISDKISEAHGRIYEDRNEQTTKTKSIYKKYTEDLEEAADEFQKKKDEIYQKIHDAVDVEKSMSCHEYLNGIGGGDGVTYSKAKDEYERKREGIKISKSCLEEYLRKYYAVDINRTPDSDKESGFSCSPKIEYYSHAPSSDAIMRAFADIENMRIYSHPRWLFWTRDAHTISHSYGGADASIDYIDAGAAEGSLVASAMTDETGVARSEYSNTDFSLFIGDRYAVENQVIKSIHATVELFRAEHRSSSEGQEQEKKNIYFRRVTYARVEFKRVGVQAKDELERIDAINDNLQRNIERLTKNKEEAIEQLRTEYHEQLDKINEDYKERLDNIEETYQRELESNESKYVRSWQADAKSANDTISEIRDSNASDEVKEQQIEKVLQEFLEKQAAAGLEKGNKDMQASISKMEAEAKALELKSERERVAKRAFDDSQEPINETCNHQVQLLSEAAGRARKEVEKTVADRKERIEENYAQELSQGNNSYTSAASAADEGIEEVLAGMDESWYEYGEAGEPHLTEQGRREMPQETINEFTQAVQDRRTALQEAEEARTAARNAAKLARWSALKDVEEIRENNREKWTAEIKPVDAQELSGVGADYDVRVMRIFDVDVELEPRTLTGADFSDYYRELEDEEGEGGSTEDGASGGNG